MREELKHYTACEYYAERHRMFFWGQLIGFVQGAALGTLVTYLACNPDTFWLLWR